MRKKRAWQDQAETAERRTAAAIPSRDLAAKSAASAGDPSSSPAPWIVAFCLLSLMLAAMTWLPVAKISSPFTVAINEGFNTYYESAAAHGEKIYGAPPRYTYANYPPLSYHLIAWLGSRDFNVTGRWLSFAAYLAIGVFTALIVQQLSGSWRLGAYAAMCWLVWLAAFEPARVAFNYPHVLGMAFSLAALYCFVRGPESVRWLCFSAVLFALSLFTKHSLVAFPAAVAVQLFLSSRRRFGIWLIAAVLACSILLLITLAVDGPYFLPHLLSPRAYYPWDSVGSTRIYLSFTQVGFALAVIWSLRHRGLNSSSILIWSLVIAHLVAIYFCSGAGAAPNHFYDAMIATAMIVALALPGLERLIEGVRFPRVSHAVLLIVPFFLSSILILPQRIYADLSSYRGLERGAAEISFVSQLVSQQPGPALCETLMICYSAGKPLEFDTFAVDQLMRTGRVPYSEIQQLLESRHFQVIQIDWNASEPLEPKPRVRFPGPIMRTLFANYQVKTRTDRFILFVPR